MWASRPNETTASPSASIGTADIQQSVQAAGTLQAKVKVEVGAQVSGQVQRLHVQLGQTVRKGDLLVSLDPELGRSDVAQAEAAHAQQQAMLDSRRIDLLSARREVERQHRLLADNATAATEVERADTELAKLDTDVRGQVAVLARLQADLTKKQLALGYTRINAPMDGTVVNLAAQEGQTVIAVQVPPIMMTLANLDTLTVRTRVAEADIQSIQVGQKAYFVTLAGEANRYEGKVRVIQPIPERVANAVFYNVLFEVDNSSRKLLLDMTVQVEIITGSAKNVAAIPIVALGERDSAGLFSVYVLDAANKTTIRKVRIGLQDGVKAQVIEGVSLGDRVLLAPPANSGSSV